MSETSLVSANHERRRNHSRLFERGFIFICFLGYTVGLWLYWRGYYETPGTMEDGVRGISSDISSAHISPSFPPDSYMTSSALSPDLIYTWENPYSYPVKFQIASQSDFTGGVVVEKSLTGTAVQGRFLPPGTYYWRIVTETASAVSVTHPIRLVVLRSFGSPEVLTPREGENIKISEGIPVDFRWERLNYADTYEFKLYSVGIDNPLYEISSLGDTVVQAYFDPRTIGRYRWTVQATMEFRGGFPRKRGLVEDHFFSIGPLGAPSIYGFVRGVIKAGSIHTPITLLTPWEGASLIYNPLVSQVVRWSSDESFLNFRVIFSRDQDPVADPKAIIQYVEKGETSIPLPALNEGVWYWIVQGDRSGAQGFSAASPSWFTIQPRPLLDAPQYVLPSDEAVIGLEQLTESRRISFIWEDVPESDAYIFSLFEAKNLKLLYSSSPLSATSFILTDLAILTADDYTWQVEAVSLARNGTIERRGSIKQSSFSVNIPHSDILRTTSQGTIYGY